MIVINYTGDRIHFGLAVEKAKQEGLKVYFMKVLVKPKHVDVVLNCFTICDFKFLIQMFCFYLSSVG